VDVVPFGVVLSDRRGRARFKFDSRTHRYPSGFSSLLPFSGGWIDLRDVGGAGWGYAQRFPYLEAEASRGPFEDAVDANEANAIAALRQIAAAQDAFLAAKACDVDQDGVAEYGLLREMSGTIRVRTAADASTAGPLVQPSLLPAAFGASNDDSDLPRSGYLFHVMLPGAAGIGVPERSQGALAQALNIDLSETTWCCYAWPEKYEKTGRRAFFINQSGDILSTETIWYSGTGAFTATNTGAAFRAGGSVTNITGQVATGTRGRDGNLWRPVPSRPADHEFSVSSVLTPVEPDSGVSGTFTLRSVETRNDDRGIAELEVCGGARNANWRFVVTNGADTKSGGFYDRVRDGSCLRLGNRFVYDVRPFAGGTVEIRDGDTPVLRGTLPALTTVLGASVPGSTASFRATGWLDAAPRQLPKRGAFDLRVTNSEAGMRRELTVVLTTHDRLAGPATVTFFDAVGAPTPLGTITPRGRKGEGTLRIDSDTGEAPPATGPGGLSGGRIEIRDEFGTLLVSGALPVVE
jgi:hypothetical protein